MSSPVSFQCFPCNWLSWLGPSQPADSEVQNLPPPCPSPTPPLTPPRPLKTERFSFNHVDDFAIEASQLFYKAHGCPDAPWQPIPCPVEPETVRADGANLMIRSRGQVFYKKALLEYRDQDTNAYRYLDIANENNWVEGWFQLIKDITHLPLEGSNLLLPQNWRDWACSHRGLYCDEVQDGIGQTHERPPAVTSVYVLLADGETILVFDPYIRQKVKVVIKLPATPDSTFDALRLSASASTLMVLGYEQRPNDAGPGVSHTLKILTRLEDNDTIGSDPILDYAYPVDATPDKFVIPLPDWQAHPLSLTGEAAVTGTITIFQTGPGNNARELRIEGKNEAGATGYYRKMIDDPEWSFVADPGLRTVDEYLPQRRLDAKAGFNSPVLGPLSGSIEHWGKPFPDLKVSLLHYRPQGRQATLRLEQGIDQYDLLLYRRKTGLDIEVNLSDGEHDLVRPPVPPPPPMAAAVSTLLGSTGNSGYSKVALQETDQNVSILSSVLPWRRFSFLFGK